MVENWFEFKGMSLVPRIGYGKYGVYPDPYPNPCNSSRWESDLEHTAGLWKLTKLIQQNFPGEVFEYWELQDALEIADIHEIGEQVTGDVCDDGDRDARTLDTIEREFIKKTYLVGYSKKMAKHLYKRFVEFQERSTCFGRTMYCCDKCEAILQGLFYEKQGRGGRLYYITASRLELEAARRTNSYDLVDVWLYSFVKNAHGYEYFELFIDLIVTAGQIIRGTDDPFPWLGDMIKQLKD